jgi:phosphoribosylanthranilate isomerase
MVVAECPGMPDGVKIKICGITSIEDAARAAEAGADALGFMFYARTPRCLSIDRAAAIHRALSAPVARVGVFVDPEESFVREAIAACGLDILQFHGEESPEFCRRFAPHPVWKAFRMAGSASLRALPAYDTAAWLLDAYVPGQPGGSGTQFNWELAVQARQLGRPIVLAGGLAPENVRQAIQQVRPWGVDVSSGVESAPGRKDPARLRAFIDAVRDL